MIGNRWVRLAPTTRGIRAECVHPVADWSPIANYLQIDTNLNQVLASFPDDPVLRDAVASYKGLRLLRQEPWECLASFILSSSKQIVQIEQIVAALCERWGTEMHQPALLSPAYAFPSLDRIAACSENELRSCKMGFRAPFLKATARMIASGEVNLGELERLPVEQARAALMELPGVGRKIADCVLLFAYGFSTVFPIDVWVAKSLREDYFSGQPVNLSRLTEFAAEHFGPYAGYAQQYLFHRKRVGPRVGGSGKTNS